MAQPEDEIGAGLTIAAAQSTGPILPSWQSMDDTASEVPAQPNRSRTHRGFRSALIARSQELPEVPASLMTRYNREELYEKVWAMPMRHLAKEYAVSNVALAKTCKKLHVPVPGRGYWAKKAANRPVEPRPPLPVIPIRSQQPKRCPQQAVAKIAAAGVPQPAPLELQHVQGTGCNKQTPTHPAGTSRVPNPRKIPTTEESLKVSPLLLARYDREELYEKVWTLTMQKAAQEYGVSDVALGKTCRKLHIPVPGRGYWAKKAANRPVEPRPPLPRLPPRTEGASPNTPFG